VPSADGDLLPGAIGPGGPMEGRGVPHAVAVAGARCAGAASSERFVEVARRACPVAAARPPDRKPVRPCRVAFTGAVVGAVCTGSKNDRITKEDTAIHRRFQLLMRSTCSSRPGKLKTWREPDTNSNHFRVVSQSSLPAAKSFGGFFLVPHSDQLEQQYKTKSATLGP
jgi:hypothetical protein